MWLVASSRDGTLVAMGESSIPLVHVRGRGPLVLQLRLVGVMISVLASLTTWALLAPDDGAGSTPLQRVGLAVVVAVALAWQLWLLRPSVVVTAHEVQLRGLWATTSMPADDVVAFETTIVRMPLDLVQRNVGLVVRRADGTASVFGWVGWMDMISPFLTGASRPPTRSQQKVLSRLGAALEVARGSRPGSSGTAVAPH